MTGVSRSAALDCEDAPECPPGPASVAVGIAALACVGDELAVDRVGDPAFEAAQCLHRGLGLGELGAVVGAAFGVVAGLFRPRAAGYLILTVSVVPLLLTAVGAASHFYEPLLLGLLLAPLLVSGVLFLLPGRQQGNPHPSGPLTRKPVLR